MVGGLARVAAYRPLALVYGGSKVQKDAVMANEWLAPLVRDSPPLDFQDPVSDDAYRIPSWLPRFVWCFSFSTMRMVLAGNTVRIVESRVAGALPYLLATFADFTWLVHLQCPQSMHPVHVALRRVAGALPKFGHVNRCPLMLRSPLVCFGRHSSAPVATRLLRSPLVCSGRHSSAPVATLLL
jgi:hypothetical protein